jgi:hypothetical protein
MVGSFSIGDDERIECRIIADALGRSPSSVDRQWRNIAALLKGDTQLHIGKMVREVLEAHLDDPIAGRRLALRVAERNRWPLARLIQAGEATEDTTVAKPSDTVAARRALLEGLEELDYSIFPSGSHGFGLTTAVTLPDARRCRCYVSCTLISQEVSGCAAFATVDRVKRALRSVVERVKVLSLPSGGLSVVHHSRLEIARERFSVVIRLVQLEKGSA